MDKVHVLVIPSWYPTQDNPINGIFFREQAHALANHGVKAGVVFPQLDSLRHIYKASMGLKVENDCGVPTYRYAGVNVFPRFPKGNQWLFKQAGLRAFQRYVTDHGMPDILHAHSALNGGLLGAYIKSSFDIPLVLTEHSSAYARQLLSMQKQKKVGPVFDAADRLIAVSPQLGVLLERQFPSSVNRWQWAPNIVDPTFFETCQNQSHTPSHSFIFLNVALMTENKGQKDLITAFAHAFGGQTNVELWLGGDGPIRNELEAIAKASGVESQVRFLGMLDRQQVKEAMCAANVFVLSSHYETFGVVLIEALALGTPVIATRCGGPECIVRKEDGILVPVKDVTALGQAMSEIKRTIADYDPETLRSACYNRFSAEAVINQLKSVYHELL